jgi:hypothetical protein
VTIALSTGFIFSAAGAQYTAVLQRDLRYFALTIIDVLGVLVSTVVAVAMAAKGFGYWSLVVSAIVYAAANTTMMWLVVPWRPGLPRRNAGVASMLKFGGTVTLNSLVVYVAYNLDKVLLGRFWGADALGLYTRASQLINIPTAQLNAAIGGVAFSALSPGELFLSMLPPLSSAAVAAAVAFATLTFFSHFESALARLTLGGLVTAVVYAVMLLVVMGQRTLYLGLASQLRAPSAQ